MKPLKNLPARFRWLTPMSFWWHLALREWDRLVIGLCFIAYGIECLIEGQPYKMPLGDFLSTFQAWEFVVAGTLYIVGVLLKSWAIRGVATVIYAMGLLTISLVVMLGSGSPTLWLVGAFALQGFADLRRLRAKNEGEKTRDVIDAARRTRG